MHTCDSYGVKAIFTSFRVLIYFAARLFDNVEKSWSGHAKIYICSFSLRLNNKTELYIANSENPHEVIIRKGTLRNL